MDQKNRTLFSSRSLLGGLLLILLGSPAIAEQMKSFGDYDVYYSAFNSTFIEPKAASQYKLVRANDLAIINITVRKRLTDKKSRGQKAIIKGHSFDLIHRKELQFQEIKEGDAIYYLSEVPFRNKDELTFTIKIQPDPNKPAYTLEFKQQFFTTE